MFHTTLNRIQPNPWQTRQDLDPDHIQELAKDIAARYTVRPETRGLLQVPLARIVDENGQAIPLDTALTGDVAEMLEDGDLFAQLAFGHNRLAAFELLVAGKVKGVDGLEFDHFPLEYAPFTDEEMATAAWTENSKRKDLSALEEALAIQHALEAFGWTKKSLAKRWGLSPSAISNKLRLLNLPDDVQTHLRAGEISERQAMAILPVFELPQPAMDRAKQHWKTPTTILKAAREGRSSNNLRITAADIIRYSTKALDDAPFPLDQCLTYAAQRSATCTDCDFRITHQKQTRCSDPECWDARAKAWATKCLADATEATGIQPLPDDVPWSERETFYSIEMTAQELLAQGCDNLRLEFNPQHNGGTYFDTFPDVRIICHHQGANRCKCLSAKQAAATRERNANDPDVQARKEQEKQVQSIVAVATQALATILQESTPAAWLWILHGLNSSYKKKGHDWPLDKIIAKVAKQLIDDAYRYTWPSNDPGRVRNNIAEKFNEMGLPLPWPELSPLEQVSIKLNRVTGWIRALTGKPMPSTPALNGNVTNLEKLALELAAIESSDERTELEETLVQHLDLLYDLRPIAERWDPLPDIAEWNQHGSWLLTVPPGDVNFKSHLKEVTRPNVIEYAGVLLGLQQNTKTKLAVLDRRLRALLEEKNQDET